MSIAALITRGVGPDSSIAAAVLRGFSTAPVNGSLLPLRGFGPGSSVSGILLRGFLPVPDVPATQQQAVCTSTSWTGDSLQEDCSPAVAVGDIFYTDFVTTPGGYPIQINGNGTVEIDARGDQTRQSFMANIYDTSLTAFYGAFRVYINNAIPQLLRQPDSIRVLINSPIPVIDFIPTDLSVDRYIVDANDDVVTSSVVDGSLQTGITLTNNKLSGTPTVASDNIVVLRFIDPATDFVDVPLDILVDAGATVPDVLGDTLASATNTIESASLTVFSQINYVDSVETPGTVIMQSLDPGIVTFTDTPIALTIAQAPIVEPPPDEGTGGTQAVEDGPIEFYPIELAEKLSWLKNYAQLRENAVAEADLTGGWARWSTLHKLRVDVTAVPGYPRFNT